MYARTRGRQQFNNGQQLRDHPIQALTKPLQTRINRLAHRFATQQEPRIKSELIEQLQAARRDGATLDDLSKLLDAMESPA
ncbi:MAG: hypothetical protein Q7U84_02140 [Polynucleobacter sp.]|nr:hypothetical protein [Polynucleobacter sp.]